MKILKRLCLFSSYSSTDKVDNYVRFYVTELRKHFDEIVFLTNERSIDQSSLDFLTSNNVVLKKVPNGGYDFGMYYHALKDLDVTNYESVAFVNDSCYLFKPLDAFFNWAKQNSENFDAFGFTDSVFKGRHLQSYFLLFNRKVLLLLKAYFVKNGIIEDVIKLIEIYEIGFCKYLLDNGFKIGAMYSQLSFGDHQSNIMTEKADQLLSRGIPLIKKKIVNNSFRPDEVSYLEHVNFDFSVDYRKLLYNYADKHLLDYLLMNFTTKVYQIYYDVEQIKYLSPDTLPHYNSKLSVYFENDLIRDFYDAGKIDSDYFGILSWRFQEKNGVQFKSTFVDAKHDIYAFANSAYRQDVFEDSVKCHPYFMDIFNIVLKNLKIDSNVRPQIGLYQNTVIARGDIYRKYVSEYLIPTMDLLNRFPDRFVDLNQKLWADAKYKYDPALTQRLFEHTGKPYYTYHTFICERLWSIFYEVNKDKYDLKILNRLDFMDAPVPRARQLTPISPQLPVVPGFRGSSVEAPIEKPKPAEPDYKDCAICISHQQSTHTLEKVNNENRVYDLFLASNESVNISKWQNSFKKHKIVSSKSVDAVQSRVDRVTLQSIFLCSAVMQLWMEEEQISKHRYKVVVFANNLNVLSNLIDVNRSKTQADTIYAKKGNAKYWYGRSDVMAVFSKFFLDQSHLQSGSFDDAILQFALRRNIKIIET